MAYDVTATFSKEQRKLSGTYPIEMFVVNASITGSDYLYYANLNQDVYGYALDSNGEVTSTATLYTGLPISRDEMSNNIRGEISGLTISVPNVDRVIESVIHNNSYLRGREVHVIYTFAKHLPSNATSALYIGSDPDFNSCVKEKYYVDSTTSNKDIVTFVCKSKFDIKNVIIPGRRFTPECQWALHNDYLGSYCDPSSAINSASFPSCDGTTIQCKERHNIARFGGFPSIPVRGV